MSIILLSTVFLSSFVFAIGAVASPGPVTTAIVSQAPRRGWTVGPLLATGHALMELILVVLIAFGLSSGLNTPGIQLVIAAGGGLLLVWMGADMLNGVYKGQVRVPGTSSSAQTLSNGQFVRLGILTTLSNPFWYAWWVTAVPAYLHQMNATAPAAIAAFYFGHISADFAWDTFLSSVIASGRKWITDGVYRWVIGLCGAFFLYLGISFLVQAYSLF